MLVLSRKQAESLVIDGGIRVTVLRINGNKVRLGIEAPSDVTVKRSELQPQAVVPLAPDGEAGEMDVDYAIV